jgi:hypothetical protein
MIITPLFIVFIILVFVLTWLFANTIDKRKWVSLLISIIATPIVYFYVFYPFINIFFSYHHQKHFDSDAWKAKPALRYEMSTEVVNQNLFVDKWNYNLGFKPGAFNMTQECLEIVFENDKAMSVSQYQMEKKFE